MAGYSLLGRHWDLDIEDIDDDVRGRPAVLVAGVAAHQRVDPHRAALLIGTASDFDRAGDRSSAALPRVPRAQQRNSLGKCLGTRLGAGGHEHLVAAQLNRPINVARTADLVVHTDAQPDQVGGFADAAAPGLVLSQPIGRWGNWFSEDTGQA